MNVKGEYKTKWWCTVKALIFLIGLMVVLTSCGYISTNIEGSNNNINDTFSIVDSTTYTPAIEIGNNNELQNNTDNNISNNEMEENQEEDTDEETYAAKFTVTEGETITLDDVLALDPDGDNIEIEFSKPFNNKGVWVTKDGDAGEHTATLTASDGILTTVEKIKIIVNPSNKPPVIDCEDEITVKEGDIVELDCDIYDMEGDEITSEVFGWMDSYTKQTGYDDEGEYIVSVKAADGNRFSVKEITVNVENLNRAPIVDLLDTIRITEGDTVQVDVSYEDPDGDDITITYPNEFNDDGTWETMIGDAGIHTFTIIVSDGENHVSVPLTVEVSKFNTAPIISPIEDIEVAEGDLITINVVATDEQEDDLIITFSGFMNSSTYQTDYEDAGDYNVLITVSDGQLSSQVNVPITIFNTNRPPVFVFG